MSGYVDAYCELETEGLADGEKPMCDMTFDLIAPRVRGGKALFGKDTRALAGKAMASTPRGPVGFEFELDPVCAWRRQKDDGLETAWGCITVRSIGEATDQIVREYGAWFGVEVTAPAMSEMKAPAVVIGASPSAFEREKLHTKLFLHHADVEETYAEVFLNIDVPAGRVQLREKDEDYRGNLVSWLQGRHGQPDGDWVR